MMNIQDMLEKYHTINKDMMKLSQDLRTAIEAATNNDGCIKASLITDSPRGSNTSEPTYQNTEDLIEQLEEIGIELANLAKGTKEKMQDLMSIKSEIDIAYFMLEPEEQMIIRLRYMEMPKPQYTWEQVADAAHYSRPQALAIHGQALKKMRQVVNIRLNQTFKVV
jgi:DNA-directed RNA polymerase sigma subunit (sigma70/sigma32)